MTSTIRDYGTAAPGDFQEPERVKARDLKRLGTVKGIAYATTPDGRELRIGKALAPYELGNRPPKGTLWVIQERAVGGGFRVAGLNIHTPGQVEEQIIEAQLVEPGTYAALAARAEAKARKADPAPRRHDLAETFDGLQRQDPEPLVLGGHHKAARLLLPAPRGPVRGLPAIVGWLQAQGVDLSAVGGHLDVRAAKLPPPVAEVVRAFEPLLLGHVSGHPVPCAMKHSKAEPAYTLAVGGMPVCERHLSGELTE